MSKASQSLRPLLDRMRRAWRGSPLPDFFRWWGGELRALLPASWQRLFGGGDDWYLLEHEGNQWSLRHAGNSLAMTRWSDSDDSLIQQAALTSALKHVDREDLRLALLLPAAAVLRRTLALPLAARDNLQQVMGFEIDRQTPFSAAQVYYAVRELPQAAAAAGRVNAELVAVTRGALDPLLERLLALAISIDAVDVVAGHDRLGINLLPPERTPHRVRPRLRLNLALAACCLLLLLASLATYLHNRQTALASMQDTVESMRSEAQQVSSLRQQLQDNAGAAGFLARRKMKAVSMLSLMQDITARLPDTAWLERFSVDNSGQVGLQGQSVQAAKLLDALKDSKLITDASFQGSIQPDPATGKERFYLTAQLRQPPAGKGKSSTAGGGGVP
ncbi:general secretion pathway protein L [Rhodanobacter sp. ANJX3]|uniref:PilN domain-containing protein n=1 Tax=unclassified Rhodanobacter TaxID=2621553 RepID=UPI0015CDB05F|nr:MULTISPECIES: PilN domain-containing protein [unclassified Rhodanobacter]MBB5359405.1 general secretion pathway protein L [Rhodanobacter sp. ANJX3]NYE29842.1 general secretion pathway protein L [Rhodanobacter sp. K2T2]